MVFVALRRQHAKSSGSSVDIDLKTRPPPSFPSRFHKSVDLETFIDMCLGSVRSTAATEARDTLLAETTPHKCAAHQLHHKSVKFCPNKLRSTLIPASYSPCRSKGHMGSLQQSRSCVAALILVFWSYCFWSVGCIYHYPWFGGLVVS